MISWIPITEFQKLTIFSTKIYFLLSFLSKESDWSKIVKTLISKLRICEKVSNSGCKTPFMKNERCAHLSMEFKVEKWQRLGLKSIWQMTFVRVISLLNCFHCIDDCYKLRFNYMYYSYTNDQNKLYEIRCNIWSEL